MPWILLASLGLGCSPAGVVAVDLVEALPDAEVFVETAEIDLGAPLARRYLLDGWLPDDEMWAHRPDQSFVWAIGDPATFRFFVFEQRDLVMQLTGRPSPSESDPELESLVIEVNGQPLARHDVEAGWVEYRAVVPRQRLRQGENVVELDFTESTPAPADGPSRRLAVDRVVFQRTVVSYPPRQELGGPVPALVMPYLSGAWYELDLDAGARLVVGLARAYGPHKGDPEGHVDVVVEAAGDTVRHTIPAGEAASLPLPAGPVRLALMSIPRGEPNQRAERRQNEEAVGIVLEEPVILEPDG